MNLFLPEESVLNSVMCLDDRRLIKQILEIAVLLDDEKGYTNHPVKIFYKDKKAFLAHYGYSCCVEYFFRFGKIHKLTSLFKTDFRMENEYWKSGIYASGSRGTSDCIRETDRNKVINLFRQKLISKWQNDKIKPRWTNRTPPRWYV